MLSITSSAKRIYLTGMPGTGKSSIITNLQNSGYCAVDTDYNNWKVFSESDRDWILNEEKMYDFLESTKEDASDLFPFGHFSF
ncbi:hypothetical protein RYH73_26100 [Olivibacter sp. CPCC 100613]|uniref:hypothetical protein n=1 Tax=Olivibacter sp. CPCC 100613 TaxID=3079931 RepID=UPI002FF6CA43